jgi:hypothetical protein
MNTAPKASHGSANIAGADRGKHCQHEHEAARRQAVGEPADRELQDDGTQQKRGDQVHARRFGPARSGGVECDEGQTGGLDRGIEKGGSECQRSQPQRAQQRQRLRFLALRHAQARP